MAKITWTSEEHQVMATFIKERMEADKVDLSLHLINTAQAVLPEDRRRRTITSFSTVKSWLFPLLGIEDKPAEQQHSEDVIVQMLSQVIGALITEQMIEDALRYRIVSVLTNQGGRHVQNRTYGIPN